MHLEKHKLGQKRPSLWPQQICSCALLQSDIRACLCLPGDTVSLSVFGNMEACLQLSLIQKGVIIGIEILRAWKWRVLHANIKVLYISLCQQWWVIGGWNYFGEKLNLVVMEGNFQRQRPGTRHQVKGVHKITDTSRNKVCLDFGNEGQLATSASNPSQILLREKRGVFHILGHERMSCWGKGEAYLTPGVAQR